jgi:hypothetical protein
LLEAKARYLNNLKSDERGDKRHADIDYRRGWLYWLPLV